VAVVLVVVMVLLLTVLVVVAVVLVAVLAKLLIMLLEELGVLLALRAVLRRAVVLVAVVALLFPTANKQPQNTQAVVVDEYFLVLEALVVDMVVLVVLQTTQVVTVAHWRQQPLVVAVGVLLVERVRLAVMLAVLAVKRLHSMDIQ
jgi:hypothetical protein